MNLTSGVYRITVGTGGSGYSSAPSVVISGGASAVAQMNGTAVDAVFVTANGAGHTAAPTVAFTGGGGTGAAATASVLLYGGTRVISMFRGRFNDLYGVDGGGRGFRWLGATTQLEPIGISRPLAAPTMATISGGTNKSIRSIAIVNGGAGYYSPPTVSFKGGGLTDGSTLHATARAKVSGARVVGMTVDDRGDNYSSAPAIELSGGLGAGASLSVGVKGDLAGGQVLAVGTGYTMEPTVYVGGGVVSVTLTTGGTSYGTVAPTISFATVNGGSAQATCSVSGGRVHAVTIINGWAGYDSPPAITFNHATGTGAAATVSLDGLVNARAEPVVDTARGLVLGLQVLAAGTGAVTTPGIAIISATTVAATTGGSTTLTVGSGASVRPVVIYAVDSVTAVTGGTGYMAPPAIGFRPWDGGAAAIAQVEGGAVTGATVLSGGAYITPPTAVLEATTARAIAYVSEPAKGKYKCCLRYIDNTPDKNGGRRASSISELSEVTAGEGAGGLLWSWSNNGVEARVDQLELWRTTADQELVLYRVAVLTKAAGVLPNTYTDTLSDDDLLDPTRSDFGIMPIVMPSGQVNARRFEPPPDYVSQACVFQDRAWYSADSRGEKPNSLWHSEIDEPESSPSAYEIVLQENVADSDAIVALVPFGGMLLVFQSRHLYRLQYVSQPLIDASVSLVAYRGVLNPQCVAVFDGVAFAADSYGLYAFDGSSQDTLSVPVDNYWRDGIIDFSKSAAFHVAVNPNDRVVRFYYCRSGDGALPTRALCFSLATKAWWEESYAQDIGAAAVVAVGGKSRYIAGGAGQILRNSDASLDAVTESGTAPIPYEFRSGNYVLVNAPDRSVGVLYRPTAVSSDLQVRMHYNGSSSPRSNAVQSDRGDGFVTETGSTAAVLNMRSDRSALGTAPGYAMARYAGRVDERSGGGDKHIAVAIAGTRATSGADVVVYGVTLNGAT